MRFRKVVLSAMASLLISQIGLADCFRSEECNGDEICVDRECVSSDGALKDCDGDTCGDGVCDDGFCKPDAVICENDWGRCEFGSNEGGCHCADGSSIGMGWETAGDGDIEPEPMSDPELYEMCVQSLVSGCEAPPDIDEVCLSEEDKQICTDLGARMEVIETNCDGYFEEEGSSTVSMDTDDISYSDDKVPHKKGSDTMEDVDLSAPDAPVSEADWYAIDCCESLTEYGDPYKAEIKKFMDCISELEDDDCGGVLACGEALDESVLPDNGDDGDFGMDAGVSDGNSIDISGEAGSQTSDAKNDAKGKDEEEDTEALEEEEKANSDKEESTDDGNDDADTETEAEDSQSADKENDEPEETNKADDSSSKADDSSSGGCSFVPTQPKTALLNLVEAFF